MAYARGRGAADEDADEDADDAEAFHGATLQEARLSHGAADPATLEAADSATERSAVAAADDAADDESDNDALSPRASGQHD